MLGPQRTTWNRDTPTPQETHEEVAESIIQVETEVSLVQSSLDRTEEQISAALRLNLKEFPRQS